MIIILLISGGGVTMTSIKNNKNKVIVNRYKDFGVIFN